MPAAKRTNTLSDSLLADIRETNKRVLSEGTPSGTDSPFGDAEGGDYWLKVTGSSMLSANKWEYTVDLYRTTFGSKINTNGLKARNTWELDATANSAAGYPLTPNSTECGALLSVQAITTGSWHRAYGRYKVANGTTAAEKKKRVYVFTAQNIPVMRGDS